MIQDILIKGYIKHNVEVVRGVIAVDKKSGIIRRVNYGEGPLEESWENIFEYDESYIIEPGDINAHAHPEQSIYTGIVDKNWNLSTWCRNTIYKYSTKLEPEHVYLGCCRAFSRMLSYGVTSTMVSFYCHNNKGNLYDKEVIRAAIDTGIRLYFGRMNYDIETMDAYEEKKNSQRSYFETPAEAEMNFLELLHSVNSIRIMVAPSVHSIHASTKEAIIRAINLGNKYDRYVQFHLSEDEGDVSMALKLYGLRPVEFLVRLYESGEVQSLSNLILSDCVWIDDRERELIKKYNMKVVLNPRMNNRIKTGEADLKKLLASGINPYLGTDGEASNDDLSIEGEKIYLKSRYKELGEKSINNLGNASLKFNEGKIGGIEKGSFCDLKIIQHGKVEDVFVGGVRIVHKGVLNTMDVEKEIEQPLEKALKDLI